MNNFTMIDNTVLNDQSLSITHKMIYIVLASYMDNKTRSCYPSYGTLAEKAGCSRNTAIIAIKTLVEKEYVIKVRKNNDRKHAHACNLYILAKLNPSDPNPSDPSPSDPNPSDSSPSDPSPNDSSSNNANSNKKNIGIMKDNVTSVTTLDKLPSVRKAFPQAKALLDMIEEYHTCNDKKLASYSGKLPSAHNKLPSPHNILPSNPVAPELDLLNYTQLNYTQSIYQSEDQELNDERDEILRKLDEHFDYEYFSYDKDLKARYTTMTGYIAEMLIDKHTKIRKHAISRDEIARMVFEASTGTMRDFLTHLENQVLYLGIAKIRDTQAYFKTVFIEYLRSGSLIYGQCI